MDSLEKYGKEVGVEFTLDQLIESHRRLRSVNSKRHADWLDELQKAREVGNKQGYEAVVNGEFIGVDVLKEMSVKDLINLLHDQ